MDLTQERCKMLSFCYVLFFFSRLPHRLFEKWHFKLAVQRAHYSLHQESNVRCIPSLCLRISPKCATVHKACGLWFGTGHPATNLWSGYTCWQGAATFSFKSSPRSNTLVGRSTILNQESVRRDKISFCKAKKIALNKTYLRSEDRSTQKLSNHGFSDVRLINVTQQGERIKQKPWVEKVSLRS